MVESTCININTWYQNQNACAEWKSEIGQFPQDNQCTLKRAKKMGRWLRVMPSHVSETLLSSTEFLDNDMHVYLRTNQLLLTTVVAGPRSWT